MSAKVQVLPKKRKKIDPQDLLKESICFRIKLVKEVRSITQAHQRKGIANRRSEAEGEGRRARTWANKGGKPKPLTGELWEP